MTAFPKISKNLSHRSFIGASTLVPAALMPQVGEAHAVANTRAQLAAVHSGSPAHQLLCKTDEFFIVHPRCRQHEATAGASIDVHGHTLAKLRQHKVNMRKNLGEKTDLYDIPTLEIP